MFHGCIRSHSKVKRYKIPRVLKIDVEIMALRTSFVWEVWWFFFLTFENVTKFPVNFPLISPRNFTYRE